MRFHETQTEEESALNLTSLIDMVFLLLIFFLVATTFAQEERDLRVQLPGTSKARPISAPPRQIIINIRADGGFVVGRDEMNYQALADLLTRAAKDQPDREVLIRADERSLHRHFAAVAELCRRMGISEAKIGYIIRPAQAASVE